MAAGADGTGQVRRRAKRPLTALAGPYGHPFHPLLVTVPIGAWVASLVFDLGSFWATEGDVLAVGARWLTGLGVLGALVAAAVGFLDLAAIPPRTRAWRVAVVHMALNLTTTGLFGASFALRPPEGPISPGLLVLSVLALTLLATAGWLGGMLTYRYGVRVADEESQQSGFEPR